VTNIIALIRGKQRFWSLFERAFAANTGQHFMAGAASGRLLTLENPWRETSSAGIHREADF
jgi:hypothetical protein